MPTDSTLPLSLMSSSRITSASIPFSNASFGYSASTNFVCLGTLLSLPASICPCCPCWAGWPVPGTDPGGGWAAAVPAIAAIAMAVSAAILMAGLPG